MRIADKKGRLQVIAVHPIVVVAVVVFCWFCLLMLQLC